MHFFLKFLALSLVGVLATSLASSEAAGSDTDSRPRLRKAPYLGPDEPTIPGKRFLLGLPDSSEENLLVVELRFGRTRILDPGLLAYRHPQGVLLPIGAVAAALEFPIAVRPDAGIATGWTLAEDRVFSLDLGRGEVVVDGTTRSLTNQLLERHVDDIYVDSSLLSQWFPVDFALDFSKLRITATSRERLAFEQQSENGPGTSLVLNRNRLEGPGYPLREIPYQISSWPMMEGSLVATGNDQESNSRFSFLAQGDLLAMSSEIFYDSEIEDLRWRLRRKHPDALYWDSSRPGKSAWGSRQPGSALGISHSARSWLRDFLSPPFPRDRLAPNDFGGRSAAGLASRAVPQQRHHRYPTRQ